jgi:hypothetical protein
MSTDKLTHTATYKGSSTEGEVSDYLVVGGVRLPKDAPVLVTGEVAKAASEVEGHEVDVKKASKDDTEKVQPAQETAHTPDQPEPTEGAGSTEQEG